MHVCWTSAKTACWITDNPKSDSWLWLSTLCFLLLTEEDGDVMFGLTLTEINLENLKNRIVVEAVTNPTAEDGCALLWVQNWFFSHAFYPSLWDCTEFQKSGRLRLFFPLYLQNHMTLQIETYTFLESWIGIGYKKRCSEYIQCWNVNQKQPENLLMLH